MKCKECLFCEPVWSVREKVADWCPLLCDDVKPEWECKAQEVLDRFTVKSDDES